MSKGLIILIVHFQREVPGIAKVPIPGDALFLLAPGIRTLFSLYLRGKDAFGIGKPGS